VQIWDGIYKDFEEATLKLHAKGFNSKFHLQRFKTETMDAIANLEKEQPIELRFKQRCKFLIEFLKEKSFERKSLRILDFGGGCGVLPLSIYEENGLRINSDHYFFDIVETKETVKLAKEIWSKRNPQIRFLEEIDSKSSYDLISSASAIQYVEDYEVILEKLCSLKSEYIVLEDLFAGNVETYVTLQNYYGERIPHYIFNLSAIVNLFSTFGYFVEKIIPAKILRLNEMTNLNMDNFDHRNRIPHSLSCVFRREDSILDSYKSL